MALRICLVQRNYKFLMSRKLSTTLFVLLIATISQWPLFWGQFHGEDEPMQLWSVVRMLEGGLKMAGQVLSLEYHPPLRFLLSIPGVVLFSKTELGVRFGAIALSLVMVWLVMEWASHTRRQGMSAQWARLIAGLVIATSAIFNWTSMAFGWSAIVCALLVVLISLIDSSFELSSPEERRGFHVANLALIVAFLTNTGCILLTAGLGLVYLIRNSRHLGRLIRAYLPYVLFYVLYYAYFFGVVPYLYQRLKGGPWRPVGQLLQNQARAGQTGVSLVPLAENLQGLNTYYLPFSAAIFAAVGAWLLWQRNRLLWLVLGPYVLAWSFLLKNNSQQYFLLATIPLVAMGAVQVLARWPTVLITALFVAQAAWNGVVFWRPYSEQDYPHHVVRAVAGRPERHHNIVRPWREIATELESGLGPDDRFASDVSGALIIAYFHDDWTQINHSKFVNVATKGEFSSDPTGCERILPGELRSKAKALVTERKVCEGEYRELKAYPGSPLKLYWLR